MNVKIDTQDIRWQTDDINEWVMEEAAQPELEPETPVEPVSTEPPVIVNQMGPVDDDPTIAELLVNAGNEEAALERRISADAQNEALSQEAIT
jgi:hypothetical protein